MTHLPRLLCWLAFAAASEEVKAFAPPNHGAAVRVGEQAPTNRYSRRPYLAMTLPNSKEDTASTTETNDIYHRYRVSPSAQFSLMPPEHEMNGDAKMEEPGDREKIVDAIREFQNSIQDDEPQFSVATIIQGALDILTDRKKIFNAIEEMKGSIRKEDLQLLVSIAIQVTLDTAEDAFLHLRRMPYDWGLVLEKVKEDRPTIVVLGSGWAAHALLKVADTYKLRIIVVSPSNHFVFTPMLASASVGTVEYRSMTEAVRSANPLIENYLEGKATDIDIHNQVIKVKLNSLLVGVREGEPPELEVKYDKLIVAVGVKVADSMVPGAFEHSLGLKTCDDAKRLRNSIGEALEFASRPDVKDDTTLSDAEREARRAERQKRVTFAIVGGGPTGVELAGELTDFVNDITKPREGAYAHLRDVVRIVIIHGGDDLVPQFDEDLRKHASSSLRKSGVDVLLSTKVNAVGDGFLILQSKDVGAEEGILYTGLNIWAAGTEAIPFTKLLLEKLPPEARGPQGKVNVDPWLRCPMPDTASFGSILVMGDTAAFADGENFFLPQTAQVAGQQGAYAARLLDRDYDLSVTPPSLGSNNSMMNLWLKLRRLEKAERCK